MTPSSSPKAAAYTEDRAWGQSTEHVRIWAAPPDRLRVERDLLDPHNGPELTQISVRNGRRRWQWGPQSGWRTHRDDPAQHHALSDPDVAALLDPSWVPAQLWLEPIGAATVAGRGVHRVAAHPRATGAQMHALGIAGAQNHTLDIDAEHGILLGIEARRAGATFRTLSTTCIQIEELNFSSDTFCGPLSASPLTGSSTAAAVDFVLSLDEAVAQAPFTVFALAQIPEDWTFEARLLPQDHAPCLVLRYHHRTGGSEFLITQGPSSTPGAHELLGQQPRAGTGGETMRTWAGTELKPARICIDREGTRVEIESRHLDPDALIATATRLRRVVWVEAGVATCS